MTQRLYADIIIEISHEQLDRPFQYIIPDELAGQIKVGDCVNVPFGAGNKILKGYCIEIKTCARVKDMDSLAALLNAREEKEMFTVITFGADLAARIKKLMPDTPVYLLIGGAPAEEFDNAIKFCLENGLDGLDFAQVWDKEHVKAVQRAGLKTMVWTVDSTEAAEQYYKWGVRDFTTNCLTPTKPEGNVFQRFIWRTRDNVYAVEKLTDAFFAFLGDAC